MQRRRPFLKPVVVVLGGVVALAALLLYDVLRGQLTSSSLSREPGDGAVGGQGNIAEACSPPPPTEYDLSVTFVPGNWTVRLNPPNQVYSTWVTETYPSGTSVAVTSIPNTGWRFNRWGALHWVTDHWVSDSPIYSNPATVSMTVDRWLNAELIERKKLTLTKLGEGTTTPSLGERWYDINTNVSVNATPATYWQFARWQGDASGSQRPITITMNSNKTVQAVFKARVYISNSLYEPVIYNGTVTPYVGNNYYEPGTQLTLHVTPNSGYRFDQWGFLFIGTSPPESTEVHDNPVTVTVTRPIWAAPTLVRQFRLDVDVTGEGWVGTSPGGNVGGAGEWLYDLNTEVTLHAVPERGWLFDHWEDDLTGSSDTGTLEMNEDKHVEAHFRRGAILGVSPPGQVTRNPAPTVNDTYELGTHVTLTATPHGGETFHYWECPGDPIDYTSVNPTGVTLDSDRSVTAQFGYSWTPMWQLVTTVQGEGYVFPSGGTFPAGRSVRVTATPAQGWLFDHWEGSYDEQETNPLVVASFSSGAVYLDAVFYEYRTLTTGTQGPGSVVADPTARPGGIYILDSEVVLTAIPEPGYALDHWIENGVALEEGPIYPCVMDQDKTVTAVFSSAQAVQVTVGRQPGGGSFVPDAAVGQVSYDPDWPGGVEEGASRTEYYLAGASVSLTAEYNLGYAFDHWHDMGVENNAGALRSIIVAEGQDWDIAAVFAPGATLVGTVAVDDGSGTPVENEDGGSLQLTPDFPGGVEQGATRYETYPFDQGVTAVALQKEGYVFDYWVEDGVRYNAESVRSILMAHDIYLTVVYKPGIPLSVTTAFDDGSGTPLADENVGGIRFTPDYPGDPRSGATRIETYNAGQSVTIAPLPELGYAFHHWEEDGEIIEGVGQEYAFDLDAPRAITAVFYPGMTLVASLGLDDPSETYPLNEQVGQVVFDPDYPGGAHDGITNTENYLPDTEVTLTAVPGEGFQFEYWEGDLTGGINPVSFPMDSDKTITAVFYPLVGTTYTLTTAVATPGAGIVYPSSGQHFGAGKQVTVQAIANLGWRFDHWSGDASGTMSATVVTMNANKSVTAHFVETRTLTISADGGGTLTPSAGAHVYDLGSEVTINAAPVDDGWRFDHWEGDVADAESATTTVVMDADQTVTAVFMRRYLLIMASIGYGSVSPDGGWYDDGTEVEITATEEEQGWRFKRWAGDVASPTSATTTVVMDADQTVWGVFVATYTLTVNSAQGGSVTPNGGTFDSDETVELTAHPNTGWRFDHWQGDVTGTENPVSFPMDADKTVTPVFVETANLTLAFVGNGAVEADGITLQSVTALDKGTSPSLTAVPDEGWRFDRWELDLTGSLNPASLVMNADKTVRVVFIQTFELEAAETAGGHITPAEGTHTYDLNTPVDVSAEAINGFRFQRWEADLTGSVNPTQIVMNADKRVLARFIPVVQLTMVKVGQGTVLPDVGTSNHDFQTVVDVSAIPVGDWMFVCWQSSVPNDPVQGSTQNPARVVMDEVGGKTITAVFEEERTLTTAVQGDQGSVFPASGSIYPDGTSLDFRLK